MSDALTIHGAEQIRARAQGAYRHMLSADPPLPMSDETLTAYRIRLLEPVKSASTDWRGLSPSDFRALAKAGGLSAAETQIYADAVKCVQSSKVGLREVKEVDGAGRPISRFYGDPAEWMDAFRAPAIVARFRRPSRAAK